MEEFSFTITQGRAVSYSIDVGANLSTTTLQFQIRKTEQEAWSTSSAATLSTDGNSVNISIAAANATSAVAPSLYRVLSNGNPVIEGKIFLYVSSNTAGDVFVRNVQTVMGTSIVAGSNITVSPDATTGKVTISSSGSGGTGDPESIRDTIASALVAGPNVTITPNDPADTITISATGGTEGGVSDHGALTGLADDDHPQYFTQGRGDARYATKTELTSGLNTKAGTAIATTTANGLMSSTDKTKLNGVEQGATQYTDSRAAAAVGGVLWVGTQEEYNAIANKVTPVRTFYFIVDKVTSGGYFNDFNQSSTGLPTGFIGTPSANGGIVGVFNNQLRIVSGNAGGNVTADQSIVQWNRVSTPSASWDVTFAYTIVTAGSLFQIFLSSDTARNTDYYQLQISPTTSRLGKKANNGTFTTIGTNLTRTSSAGTKHWCNFKLTSTGDISVFFWADGETKPTTAQQSAVADASRADIEAGYFYINVTGSSAATANEVLIDDLSVVLS